MLCLSQNAIQAEEEQESCLLSIVSYSLPQICRTGLSYRLYFYFRTLWKGVYSLLVTGVDNSVPQIVSSWKSSVQICTILFLFYSCIFFNLFLR